MKRLRKMAVLQAACLLLTGTAAALPQLTEAAFTAAAQPEEKSIGDFSVRLYSDGAVITGYHGKDTELEIPAEIEGLPVVMLNNDNEYSIFNTTAKITSVKLPSTLQAIGACAFSGLRTLEEITIPDSVTTIGEKAFYGCDHMTKVKLPNNLDKIQTSCFENCFDLKEITWPNELKEIKAYAFKKCADLITVSIPENTQIGMSAFEECSSLKEVTLGRGATLNSSYAFYNCQKLEAVHLPYSVTQIPRSTFQNCFALTSVNIPRSCTSIGESAFSYCRSLKEVTLYENIANVDQYAFINCTQLEKITLFSNKCKINESPETICNEKKDGKYLFSGTVIGLLKSTAQTWANTNKAKFEALGTETSAYTGDGNCDGEVSVDDAQFTLRAYVEAFAGIEQNLTTVQKHSCDINDDGKIDVVDAQIILIWYVNNKVAGKPLSWTELVWNSL